ncbi:hypothetical protein [Chryseobacterium sp.]|uniref:hypothetical protein n=1 Tax=Chryseobacterium sp. TaxID=1871047 RepID=UPI0024E21577|nr:hypothetical protein [Chryseobacterium sp.]
MNKEDLELLLSVIKSQSEINRRAETLISDLTMGSGANPKIKDLRDLLKVNQSLVNELEKKIKSSGE